ncbi:hypothetical protein K239x_26780 [Planctomycetes bacterium K23_9]|uniref:Uncharacterized protein n=1 Tax=Stieleria marina TaxID=1930275 RepID=A0A517NUC7_9BACT|nr:hypothetical protein K239x_26780 [Planctomycetes bacterium K23_9]
MHVSTLEQNRFAAGVPWLVNTVRTQTAFQNQES